MQSRAHTSAHAQAQTYKMGRRVTRSVYNLIKLTDKETLILKQMITFKGKTISKNNLLKSVWGYRQDISTSTVETHIYRLRKKLYKVFPNKTIIFTSDKGYKFSGF